MMGIERFCYYVFVAGSLSVRGSFGDREQLG